MGKGGFFTLRTVSTFPSFIAGALVPVAGSELGSGRGPLRGARVSCIARCLRGLSRLLERRGFGRVVRYPVV